MNPEPMECVFAQIKAERANQIAKWGNSQSLTPMEYLSIIGEEYGEVCRAVHDAYFAAQYPHIGATPGDYSQYKTELIQLATVCVAAIGNLDKIKQA